jgi:hypothetical protein
MAKALNERGVTTRFCRRWSTQAVFNRRRRLKQLGL